MPVIEEMPSGVEAAWKERRNGSGDLPLTVAVKADIGPDGAVGERWVVADESAVRVFTSDGNGQARVDLDLPLEKITDFRTEHLVGGGSLLAERGTDLVEIARYTTPLAGRMGNVARTLAAQVKGEELPEIGDEEERKCPKCGRPLGKNSNVCRACIDKKATLKRLFSYAAEFKVQAILVTLLMFGAIAMDLVPGIVIGRMTDEALAPRVAVPDNVALGRLGWLVAVLVATRVVAMFLTIVRGRLSAYLSAVITFRLRTQVFERLQTLSLSYYDKRQTGAIMTRVTQDVNELNNFLVDGLQLLVVHGLTIVGIIVVLLIANWKLTLLVLLPIPLVVWATRATWKFLRGQMERLWHLRSSLAAGLNATLTGTRVVKAFAQEDRESVRFRKRATDLYEVNLGVENWWATIFPALSLLMTSGSFIVWYLGGRQVILDEISLGTVQMFLFFLGQLYGPLQAMTRIADWLSRATTSAERVFEVLDSEPDVDDAPNAVKMPRIEGAVTFENVSFGYDKTRRVLENVDLEVKPGEMIGLVGHSGAGKTTIINLLSRFYDPVEGRILIDGVDMRDVDLHDLRRQLGIVLQEPFLFPGTITENIAYGKPDATPEEVMRAAKAANAHDFIMRFPDGYDTQAGERGTRLSGGERQRISIARAILHDPRILILDEATASVDTETEKQIQEAIARLITGRTTFAIAHRLSTLRNADRLVVIDKGKVAEMGTHDELMAKEDGIFRRLVDMQTEINKLRVLGE
ncbi:MAG TPA: ABC transporter ATP-binding protein [Armatimonadaceae bacterium]|nr:ABC transporter ATP-binding protein [Armatimonadaceae bacterium]